MGAVGQDSTVEWSVVPRGRGKYQPSITASYIVGTPTSKEVNAEFEKEINA